METEFAGVLAEGSRLQEYEIVRVLGRPGGFGITYLATDTHLHKPVAIKEFLPTGLAVRGENSSITVRSSEDRLVFDWGLKSFLNEARVLARFSHPNLVQVHRFFEANGTAYIVMEYIKGETLSEVLKREVTLDEERLRNILLPIADGLEAVHGADILHRDVKPENIIIRPNGLPVLIDFGASRNALGGKTFDVTSITTAGYSPIEQYSAESGGQGPWTDIYALGAVAYRAISGKRPLDAVDRVTADRLPPAKEIGANRYTPSLLNAIDLALSLSPDARPRSVSAWKEALLGFRGARDDKVAAVQSGPLEIAATSAASAEGTSPAAAAPPPAAQDEPASSRNMPAPASETPHEPAETFAAAEVPPIFERPPVTDTTPQSRWRGLARSYANTAALVVLALVAVYWMFGLRKAPPADPGAGATPNVTAQETQPAQTAGTPPEMAGGATTPAATTPDTAPTVPDQSSSQPASPLQSAGKSTAVPASAAATPPETPAVSGPASADTAPASGRPAEASPQIAALFEKLKGEWSATRAYLVTVPGTSCPVEIKRTWAFDFASTSTESGSVIGTYNTSFEAQSAGTKAGCAKIGGAANVIGEIAAQPLRGGKIRVSTMGVKCSGDCKGVRGLFDPRAVSRELKFLPPGAFDSLSFADGDIQFTLTRSRTKRGPKPNRR